MLWQGTVYWYGWKAWRRIKYTVTMGKGDPVNVYVTKLAAIIEAVDWAVALPYVVTEWRKATVASDSTAALQVVANLRHQSRLALMHDGEAKGKYVRFS